MSDVCSVCVAVITHSPVTAITPEHQHRCRTYTHGTGVSKQDAAALGWNVVVSPANLDEPVCEILFQESGSEKFESFKFAGTSEAQPCLEVFPAGEKHASLTAQRDPPCLVDRADTV